jgi:RNA polymerase sigma-70 factor, ECF subfamily
MEILDRQLAQSRAGGNAHQQRFADVYNELKRIASCHMRSERLGLTIQTTALVHEAFLKLARSAGLNAAGFDRQHFLSVASQAMRRILVDRARARIARKRDAHSASSGELPFQGFASSSQFVDLHEALERLALVEPRHAKIVEMRFFGGLTEDEIADVLGICSRTVKRDWKFAKAWLFGELSR